jgi:hypothetical protein
MGAPHREKLQSATQTWLKTGHTVIYAWCYSFYTFNAQVCPDSFNAFFAANTQYMRAKRTHEAHVADTTTPWPQIGQLRKASKDEMVDLGKKAEVLSIQVEKTRDDERAAALKHTLATTAERDWHWLPSLLQHPTLSRPKMPPRRPAARKSPFA